MIFKATQSISKLQPSRLPGVLALTVWHLNANHVKTWGTQVQSPMDYAILWTVTLLNNSIVRIANLVLHPILHLEEPAPHNIAFKSIIGVENAKIVWKNISKTMEYAKTEDVANNILTRAAWELKNILH